jgi:hypothetical protein
MFGSLLRQKLENQTYLRWFNISMALLLVISVLPVALDVWSQLTAV